MELKTRKLKTHTIVELPEVVNYEINLLFKSQLERICKSKGQNIGVDLAQVSFIGSLGIGLLSFAKRMVEESGGSFYLLSPSSAVRKIIHRAGLERAFTIYEDETQICSDTG